MLTYPYGDTYNPDACHGNDSSMGAPAAVGSFTGCGGGFGGLFDFSGNVEEWIDICQDQPGNGSNDLCPARGGSYTSGPEQLTCASENVDRRENAEGFRGVRCCFDL
jgi:formylglycine-generating enzyme